MKRLTIKLPAIKKIQQLDYKYKVDIFGGYIEENRKQNEIWLYHKAIDKLAEYENTNLTPKEIVEMRADATALFKENKQLRKENEELKKDLQDAIENLKEKLECKQIKRRNK